MKIYHDSRNIEYREPFGAAECGSEIRLSIDIEDSYPEDVRLMIWRGDDTDARILHMSETGLDSGSRRYTASIEAPDDGCLLWYAFAVETEREDERQVFYYGNNEAGLGGVGRVYRDDPTRYQITVYTDSQAPSWYKEGIVYQIFPDRFARDDNWRGRCEASVASINSRKGGERRLIQEDWNRRAYYIRDDNGRVTDWPIYGGSFKGIEAKLDYLKSLGVTAIYLNPVFDAVSNHRYDTADYMKIDPALGTEEEFAELAAEAGRRDIRLILDGVFSHTGSDSRYFDRYGNYSNGAYNDPDSPYRSWYRFDENESCGYKSWWGVDDLPEVNEDDPGFRELITGEQGVVAHWMELGASGWRLDVADELPDGFIRDIRSRIRSTDNDGLLIGEVWEDASNKVSYGERRRYFMGDELDGVMNYPLRDLLLDYINYTVSSGVACERLESLRENYPRENFYSSLNLIGSHDRERIITMMAAEEDYGSAVRKVKVLSSLQYALPGVPCIYYGDEVGLIGRADPENRNGYPWGYENLDLGYHYRMLGLIYDEHPVLRNGDVRMLSGEFGISDDVFAFIRYFGDNTDIVNAPDNNGNGMTERILVLANRSYSPVDVDLRDVADVGGGYALELLTSTEIGIGSGGFTDIVHMDRLSSMIICIRDKAPKTEDLGRGAGVICHISSLGGGRLGSEAREFADFLASAGMSVWQVLPLNPAGTGGSPYSSFASMAGDPDFINRDELPDMSGYEEFVRKNSKWLNEYAAYTIISEIMHTGNWSEWPEHYRKGEPAELIAELYEDHSARIRELITDQYYFDSQWRDLREYANSIGIRMMGDLPMYMARDSADVWGSRDMFRLDENGRLKVHAGVPPDSFSSDGQDWGNPLYDWDALRDSGYGLWMDRLRQCSERFDILRIDHFRGLSEYYAIPDGGKASDGVWQHSGGLGFLDAVRRAKGSMELVAEDLGFLDAGVKDLLKLAGLPGMDIWQFSSDEMISMPEDKARHRIFCSGTHDNDTLVGYVKDKLQADRNAYSGDIMHEHDADPDIPDEDYLQEEAEIQALRIMRTLYDSPASLVMVQLQDMFLLDTDARMNVPGIAEGNWTWRMPGSSVYDAFDDARERAEWFRELAENSGR